MAQEATVLVYEMTDYRIDNSEWMRNGDYYPTRKRAQEEAVNLLFNVKTQSNPENTVGLMTMAGKWYMFLLTESRNTCNSNIGFRQDLCWSSQRKHFRTSAVLHRNQDSAVGTKEQTTYKPQTTNHCICWITHIRRRTRTNSVG